MPRKKSIPTAPVAIAPPPPAAPPALPTPAPPTVESAAPASRAETAVAPRPRGRPRKEVEPIPYVDGLPEGNVVTIPVTELDLNDTDLEFRVDPRLKDLVEDLRHNGQQFPVILRKKSNGLYQIISGFRRSRSIISLGWPTIRAIVRTDLDDDAAFRISFLENERRKDLTGTDKAHAIAKLRIRGKSDGDIREIYGIGQRQLDRYRSLATFPPEILDAIRAGRIGTTHALVLMKRSSRLGAPQEVDKWIDRIESEKLSVRALARALNAEVGRPRSAKRYLEQRADGGFRLYPMVFDPTRTDASTRARMLEKLKAAISMLEKTEPPK